MAVSCGLAGARWYTRSTWARSRPTGYLDQT